MLDEQLIAQWKEGAERNMVIVLMSAIFSVEICSIKSGRLLTYFEADCRYAYLIRPIHILYPALQLS
jgi:hypothetical protein